MLYLAALALALAPAARAQAAQQASPCLTDPSQPQCANYVYPAASIEQDIDSNCQAMPWMVGCSVRRACAEGRLPSGSPYCAPFSVLATSCVDAHMDGMRGCLSYIALCSRDSAVPQCSEHLPIPRVVHTMASQVRPRTLCQYVRCTTPAPRLCYLAAPHACFSPAPCPAHAMQGPRLR